MSKITQTISHIVYRKFKLLWITITAALLLLAFYTTWEFRLQKSYKNISQIGVNLTNRVDRFVEDVFQDIYSLPVYENYYSNCKTGLYRHLERISLNNPKISGIVISKKNKVVCSTLTNNEGFTLSASSSHKRSLIGPFNLHLFEQPVYIIQQKIGQYTIGIILLESIFEHVLLSSDNKPSLISLHNTNTNKNILSIARNSELTGWEISKNPVTNASTLSNTRFAEDKLHSIDGASIQVVESPQLLINELWSHEVIVCFIILLISFVFYFLIKNLIAKRYSLLGAMKLAIKNKEFYPEYQPLFDKESGIYGGVEILLRWQADEEKIIMPDFFIQEAESSGIIVPITLQIIEIAFIETKEILVNHHDFHLSFNISALHFTDPTFFNKFNILVKEYNIHPKQIVFEITERDLLDKNNDIFNKRMQELRKSGFSLAVDDYGTGHASISYLQNFPFNYLKIDKVFIQAIGTKALTESLNDAIISMAKSLNLIIIAEGVETEEQVRYLSENGVRFLQGWYFSKAISIEKLTNLLNGEKNETQN